MADSSLDHAETLPVQVHPHSFARRLNGRIPRVVGEAAWQGYDADGHGSQSCQRIHERGGFGLAELGYYLALAVALGRVKIEVVDRG